MAEDFSNAVEQLKGMFSSEEGQDKLKGILGMFAQGGEDTLEEQSAPFSLAPSENSDGMPGNMMDNMQMIMKLQSAYQQMSKQGNSHAQFLQSLKPYLKQARASKIDSAVKMINMARIASVMKDV